MTRSRRDFLKASLAAALTAGAAGTLLAACGDDEPSGAAAGTTSTTAPLLPVSAMMPFPLYLAFIAEVASISGGFMADAGVDLDLQFARSAPQALQQLAAGNVLVVRNSPIGVVRAVSQENAPFVSIATANQEMLYRLVSTPDDPVDSLDQLPGTTVGMATLGGNAEDTLNLVLRAKGIDPATVAREAVGNEAAALTFVEQGRVQSLFGTIESAASMRAAGLEPHVAEIEGANPLLGTAVVTTRDALTSQREALVSYLRGLRETMLALADEDRRRELMAAVREDWELPQLEDPDAAEPVVEAISSLWFAAGEDNLLRNVPERWAEGVAGFERMKIAAPGADPATFYTNELLEEAVG